MRNVLFISMLIAAGCSLDAGVIPPPPVATFDEPTPDAALPDVQADVSNAVPGPCPIADDSTLALYTFDTATLDDEAALRDGVFFDGAPRFVTGPADCGLALALGSEDALGEIPHAPDWDRVRSIDFWFRLDEARRSSRSGIVTRDASGVDTPGHIAVQMLSSGHLVVRLQREGRSSYECSGLPVPVGRWTHVGVQLGAPGLHLYLDGIRQISDELIVDGPRTYQCGDKEPWGIEGNENPWVVGAGTNASEDGGPMPVSGRLVAGVIDHLRFSDVRRQFAR